MSLVANYDPRQAQGYLSPDEQENEMADEKMSLIEELQNPPRVDGGGLDEPRVVDLMRVAASALSTMIGVAASLARCPQDTDNG